MIKRVLVGLAVMTVVLGCVRSGDTPNTSPPSTAAATTASPSPDETSAAAEIDRAFIDMMVPHHQSAIEMAKLAQQRAEHDEVTNLADGIVSAQQTEIDQLKSWRSDWFGSDATPPMDAMPIMPGVMMPGMPHGIDGGTMDMTADMEMLRTANPFDRAFLEAMITHHQSAIAAAEVILPQTEQPQIRALAEDIIEAQQVEIDQMEEWLAEWYPQPS